MSLNKFRPQKISFQSNNMLVNISLDENGKINLESENSSIEIIKILDQAFKQIQNVNKYGFDSINKQS